MINVSCILVVIAAYICMIGYVSKDWLCYKGNHPRVFFSLLHNYAKGLEQSMIGPGFIFDCFGNLLCSIK